MASTVTLAVLVAAVRRRADMVGSTRRTDAEIGLEINRSAKELDGKMVSAWGERRRMTSADVTTTAAVAYVALPSDFFRLVKVGWVSGGDVYRLEPMDLDDDWDLTGSWACESYLPRYELRNEQLWLAPIPSSVETLRVHYIPVLPTITDSGTPVTFNGVHGWEDWVITDVAMKLLLEEETDVTGLAQHLARQEARIMEQAPRRDIERSHTVRRVRMRRRLRGTA